MEVTRDYIHQLLIKVDSFFQENIDPGFAVASPSKYVIKPIADLQADLSYDDIWRTGEHLSAEQLTDVLFRDWHPLRIPLYLFFIGFTMSRKQMYFPHR